MCGRGRAGVRQERTAQCGGRMFIFATTQGVQGDMPSAIARRPRKFRDSGAELRNSPPEGGIPPPSAISPYLPIG